VNGYVGTDSILVHNKTKVKNNSAVDILNKADFVESVVRIKAETNIIVTSETGQVLLPLNILARLIRVAGSGKTLAYGIPLVNYIFGKSDMKKMQLGAKRATS